jgi:hypothetical protein
MWATMAYMGNYFEWTGLTTTMKKYDYAGGQRVAEHLHPDYLFYTRSGSGNREQYKYRYKYVVALAPAL